MTYFAISTAFESFCITVKVSKINSNSDIHYTLYNNHYSLFISHKYPSLTSNSAFKIAPPAAPRMVLCPNAV
jgi:hypothetical protein